MQRISHRTVLEGSIVFGDERQDIMSSSQEKVALAYLDAVAKKDMAKVESLVATDIQFIGPAATTRGVRDLLAAFRRIGAVHVRSDIRRVFSDGDDVCVIYDFVTDTAGALPVVEWLAIEGDKIRTVHIYYDQTPWMKLREEIGRRLAAQAHTGTA